jgi:hypothetical protein
VAVRRDMMKLNLRMIMETLEPSYESVSGNPDGAMTSSTYTRLSRARFRHAGHFIPGVLGAVQETDVYPQNVICIAAERRRALFFRSTISAACSIRKRATL